MRCHRMSDIMVSNLNDSGPGSFRAALEQRKSGRIVFSVGGVIPLRKEVYVLAKDVVIDGLTAPEPGITLQNAGLIIRGNKGAHGTKVHGLRVRKARIDGIQVAYGATDVLISNCSVSHSLDGNLDITERSKNVVVEYCILGPTSKNMLIKYKPLNVALHH